MFHNGKRVIVPADGAKNRSVSFILRYLDTLEIDPYTFNLYAEDV